MDHHELFDFHTCFLNLDIAGNRRFFEYWRWQLDPWRDICMSEPRRTVRLKYAIKDRPASDWMKIGELGRGLFRCVIYSDTIGNTRWDYVWESKQEIISSFVMNGDCSEIQLLLDTSNTVGFQPFVFLSYLMPTVMLSNDAITFHGVLMEHDGRGMILSAASGTGKTTHARLWRDHKRALILNGDRATCCKEPDGSWTGFSLPWSGTSGEQINRDVPLTAFVQIEQAPENVAERLSGLDAFNALLPNLLYPGWNKELTLKALDFADDFLANVPVFRLRCRPDTEAVEVHDKALREL